MAYERPLRGHLQDRLVTLRREYAARLRTASAFGIDGTGDVDVPDGSPTVLFVGSNAVFTEVSAALSASAHLVRSFGPDLDPSVLSSASYDAVIFEWSPQTSDQIHRIRANPDYFWLPLIAVSQHEPNLGDDDAVDVDLICAVSDIGDAWVDAEVIISENRFRGALGEALDDLRAEPIWDAETELFRESFLTSHLAGRLDSSNHLEDAPILLTFGPLHGTESELSGAFKHLQTIVGTLTRAEDIAAALKDGTVAILLSGAGGVDAGKVSERIGRVVRATAFGGQDVDLEIGMAAAVPGETIDSLVERALKNAEKAVA